MPTSVTPYKSANEYSIPSVFCWTKMGTEAGQPLETILRRKEMERRAGNGTFAWGIGNSLGSAHTFAKDATPSGEVDVLFSPMKSSPKVIDVAPAQLVMWLSYYSEESGLSELPEHMLIASRGNLASGTEKRSHYALICSRQDEIRAEIGDAMIDAKRARNLVSLNPLGASQVTAMVRYESSKVKDPEKPYPIAFRAKLYREGFVRLANPTPLTGTLLAAYRSICETTSAEEWLDRVVSLKREARRVTGTPQQQALFSA
jgi:hypothetical protein